MMRLLKFLIVILLLLSTLCSCGAPIKYSILEPMGYYPTTADFSDTKWVCNEVDLWFYVFDHAEEYMIGEYSVDGATYPVAVVFKPNHMYTSMGFCFGNETSFSVIGEYLYRNDTITVKIDSCHSDIWKYDGDELTFQQVDTIAKEPMERWRCQEIDMYIDTFSDVDGYYKGEMKAENGTVYQIHAILLPGESYHLFSFEDTQQAKALVSMKLEFMDDRLVGTIEEIDMYDKTLQPYPYWPYDGKTVTFVKETISES